MDNHANPIVIEESSQAMDSEEEEPLEEPQEDQEEEHPFAESGCSYGRRRWRDLRWRGPF